MKRNLPRLSITLPADVLENLDYVSTTLSISRSALIGSMLAEALPPLRALAEQIPINPSPDDVLRLRGASEAVVLDRIEQLKGMAHDLFAEH